MFVIEAQRDTRQWVSGVFDAESDANSFLARVPDDLRHIQTVREIPFASYPVFMIERDGFDFLSRDDAIAAVRSIKRITGDEHHVYFNLYVFSSDYAPKMPGTDYMGSINHYHINNWTLDGTARPDCGSIRTNLPASTSG